VTTEFSYTVKHVEEHGRQGAYDPWSIRQMGINHKYDAAQRQNTFVILNPSQGLMKRLDNMSPDAEMLDIHRLILCAAVEHWNQYLAHLESLCKDIVSTSSPPSPPPSHSRRVRNYLRYNSRTNNPPTNRARKRSLRMDPSRKTLTAAASRSTLWTRNASATCKRP